MSSFSGCFDDDFAMNEIFGGETGNHADDSAHPLLPPSLRMEEGGQTTRPLRRRLGAGSAIAAVTSPEIRALNLPFTPPVRRDGNHSRITSLSPSTIDSSSPASSLCSATPSSRSNISQLLASLEKFEATGSDRVSSEASILADISNSSNGLQSSARSAMESILEESGGKTVISGRIAEKKGSHPTTGKVRSPEVSGILIPTFTSEIREGQGKAKNCGKEKEVLAMGSGEQAEKENKKSLSLPIQPRRQRQRQFGANVTNKENLSHPNISVTKLKSSKDGGGRMKPALCIVGSQMGNENVLKKNPSSAAGSVSSASSTVSKSRLSSRTVPFRERNLNIHDNLSSI